MADKALTQPTAGTAARNVDGYALFWGLPLALWQLVFFVAPLVFLVVMTFWTVKNFRLTPDFDTVNWVNMFSKGYVIDTYFRTLWYGALGAVVCSVLAFPASYALAFKASPVVQRIGLFMLITPFFTSYLVRIYSWQAVVSDNGVLNNLLGVFGLGPFNILGTLLGTMVGYITLTLPLVILLQFFSLSGVDRNYIEAAQNLGCGRLRTVFLVIIPLAKTGIILAGTFAFILCFGDLVSPTSLGSSKPPTLSILIVDTVKQGNNWPRAAVVALMMVLTLIVVAFTAIFFAYRVKKEKT
ncbi:MAG: ABC transporter permease [Rhodospirillaceae bacterium]|jgi:spermidine/putrescine transport system permease protein|nr:ABC transporter permease [Rhodospirillaceae bacterium]MBT3926171.1 ABC transporter permease [Rhodospirillaceae bacterium]MBT4428117.1 ABC transporter permease [Rhodospirillaceae bacterium]MBT5037328.1 ABC transporter permease [Rhodospirillaceae bacterium]MBT5676493.1 ABC transporter permease [Rhodospirillaceae bacterium]